MCSEQKVDIDIKGCDILSTMLDFNQFDCGVSGINDYLLSHAVEDSSFGVSSTTVFNENGGNDIVGFYSLSASRVVIKGKFDSETFEGYPGSRDYMEKIKVTYPAVTVDEFAVHKDMQGKQIGTKMMLRLFRTLYISHVINNVGIAAVILNARNDDRVIEFYKNRGFDFIHNDYEKIDPLGKMDTYPMMIKFKDVEEIATHLNLDFPENLYEDLL
ncbi:GNAT family N-acetyltransferase [Lactiplantibacillus plantarum subsp. plantarum]|uniref:GNAT family N-acetyltransferase n=1 Tax=Lactiplantibacillus plantarum TaxID=1590 RepID=UPI003F822E10